MKTFHAYHKEDEHGIFDGKKFHTSKSINVGDTLFVIIGRKSGISGKFRVSSVNSNIHSGSLADKKLSLQLMPLKRESPPVLFSGMPDFKATDYRNYFISTGGFKEIKSDQVAWVNFFERLLSKTPEESVRPVAELNNLAGDEFVEKTHDALADERVLREIWARRGQPKFRNELMNAYGNRCCITGSSIVELLEAAHISPHSDGGDYTVNNGLLLRADIHTLFDRYLISVDKNHVIHLSKDLMDSEYKEYNRKTISLPNSGATPSSLLLERRHVAFLDKEFANHS